MEPGREARLQSSGAPVGPVDVVSLVEHDAGSPALWRASIVAEEVERSLPSVNSDDVIKGAAPEVIRT